MVPKRIRDPTHAPPVFLAHRRDGRRPGADCLIKNRIRIRHGKNHANRVSGGGIGGGVAVLRALVADPEFGAAHGKPRHHVSIWIFDPKHLLSAERDLVKLHGRGTAPSESHGAMLV